MSNEKISQPQVGEDTYTPNFNLANMSAEEVSMLYSTLSAAGCCSVDGPIDYDRVQRSEALCSSLVEDIRHYPADDFERGMELFQALSTAEDKEQRSLAGLAIDGLLRAAEAQGEVKFYGAIRLFLGLLLHESNDTQFSALQGVHDAIAHETLSSNVTLTLFGVLAGELQMVHNGEVQPKWEQRRTVEGDQAG